jgi:hypothetical protein
MAKLITLFVLLMHAQQAHFACFRGNNNEKGKK